MWNEIHFSERSACGYSHRVMFDVALAGDRTATDSIDTALMSDQSKGSAIAMAGMAKQIHFLNCSYIDRPGLIIWSIRNDGRFVVFVHLALHTESVCPHWSHWRPCCMVLNNVGIGIWCIQCLSGLEDQIRHIMSVLGSPGISWIIFTLSLLSLPTFLSCL